MRRFHWLCYLRSHRSERNLSSSCDLLLRISLFFPGINEQGLYRIVGVNSRVQKLLSILMGEYLQFCSRQVDCAALKCCQAGAEAPLGSLMVVTVPLEPCAGPGPELLGTVGRSEGRICVGPGFSRSYCSHWCPALSSDSLPKCKPKSSKK